MGGSQFMRSSGFTARCGSLAYVPDDFIRGFLAFVPGHLIMMLLHGWQNVFSMLSGWKKDPGYLR